ncbi:MAG: class I tRNA ligase family protein [Planctomycetes bacterium]|nr:class I tRNA ligase family protein [Planctomycetota bacterium]
MRKSDGQPVHVEMAKMSKSKFNGVSPDELFEKFGADTVHAYILFVGPADQDVVYSDEGVIGIHRFLNRFWDTVTAWAERMRNAECGVRNVGCPSSNQALDADSRALRRKAHQILKRVTEAFEPPFRFNTAIAGIMELTNAVRERGEKAGSPGVVKEALSIAVQCLAPFAPHICEELWERLGGSPSIFRSPWPAYDAEAAKAEEIEVPVQINGKLRSKVVVEAGIDASGLEAAALADERVKALVAGKAVRRVIVVPGRLVNIVVG